MGTPAIRHIHVKMASREQFLDDYEISRLVCDSDDSEDETQR